MEMKKINAGKLRAIGYDARERILPTFLTRTAVHNHPARLAHEPWVNGLAITYLLEDDLPNSSRPTVRHRSGKSPQGFFSKNAATDLKTQDSHRLLHAGERPISLEDLDRWHISPEELHTQALQNLVLYSHEHTMQGQKGEGLTMLCLAAADRHNAARILLPDLHRKLKEHLGTTFYAAIPTRDTLLVFSADDPDILLQVRRQVQEDFRRAAVGLSGKLFVMTTDGIAGD